MRSDENDTSTIVTGDVEAQSFTLVDDGGTVVGRLVFNLGDGADSPGLQLLTPSVDIIGDGSIAWGVTSPLGGFLQLTAPPDGTFRTATLELESRNGGAQFHVVDGADQCFVSVTGEALQVRGSSPGDITIIGRPNGGQITDGASRHFIRQTPGTTDPPAMESRVVAVTTPASGEFTINFASGAFTAAPVVTATVSASTGQRTLTINTVSSTQFTGRIYTGTGAGPAGTYNVHYHAVGATAL
jgi:hypothetical protein